MNLEQYHDEAAKDSPEYDFYSEGSKGAKKNLFDLQRWIYPVWQCWIGHWKKYKEIDGCFPQRVLGDRLQGSRENRPLPGDELSEVGPRPGFTSF
jgi:hypothetical protein